MHATGVGPVPAVRADRGEHLLKGFDDAVRLFEVRWRE